MTGLLLCNLALIDWLASLDAGMPKHAISVPKERFRVIIRHGLQQMYRQSGTTDEFLTAVRSRAFRSVCRLIAPLNMPWLVVARTRS